MEELKTMRRMRQADARSHPPVNAGHRQAAQGKVATSSPADWQQCGSQTNADDMVEDVTTPNCPSKEPTPEQLHHDGTEPTRPILVDLEDTSNHSRDNRGAADTRNITPESRGKRVHSQPRLRVVPCAKRLLGVPATTPSGDSSADVSPPPINFKRRYKDPPGYSDARDFGDSVEPCMKAPLLQPKTHGVSRLNT